MVKQGLFIIEEKKFHLGDYGWKYNARKSTYKLGSKIGEARTGRAAIVYGLFNITFGIIWIISAIVSMFLSIDDQLQLYPLPVTFVCLPVRHTPLTIIASGVLNSWTGQVDYVDGYIVGRQKVIDMYQQIETIYPHAQHIFVVQDNWSIHKHSDVTTALDDFPRLEPVWLPTYAPWLNPIEKLWCWLRQDVLKMHRLALKWDALRLTVNTLS